MKRYIALLLAAGMSLALAGCSGGEPEKEAEATPRPTISGELTEMTYPPDFYNTPVPMDNILLFTFDERGGGSTSVGTRWSVVTDKEKFFELFPNVDESVRTRAEDFDSMLVIVVSDTVATGGFSDTLNYAKLEDGSVHVDIKKLSPGPKDMVTQAFETHYVVVAVDRNLVPDDVGVTVTVNGKPAATGYDYR